MLTRRVSQLPARRVLSQTSVIPAGDREKEGERFYPLKREAGKFKCKFYFKLSRVPPEDFRWRLFYVLSRNSS